MSMATPTILSSDLFINVARMPGFASEQFCRHRFGALLIDQARVFSFQRACVVENPNIGINRSDLLCLIRGFEVHNRFVHLWLNMTVTV
jgi:hypothetical protein